MGYGATETFDLTHFVYFSVPDNYRGVIGNWWWAVLKGEVTALRDYQWVFKGSLMKLIWFNTVLNGNESVTVS